MTGNGREKAFVVLSKPMHAHERLFRLRQAFFHSAGARTQVLALPYALRHRFSSCPSRSPSHRIDWSCCRIVTASRGVCSCPVSVAVRLACLKQDERYEGLGTPRPIRVVVVLLACPTHGVGIDGAPVGGYGID
jgi:hypothetical protein